MENVDVMNLMIKHFLLTLLSLVLLTGCATLQQKELSLSNSKNLRNSTLAHTERGFPNLEVYSTADVSGGGPTTFLIAALLIPGSTDNPDDTDINNQIQKNDIHDPNSLFRTEILKRLSESYGITNLGPEGVVLNEKGNRIDNVLTRADAQFILDTSVWWRATYLPLKMTRFRFFMQFSVQIQDKSGKLIFKDEFAWKTPRELGYPTMSQFLTNKEIGIEAQLQTAIAEALEYYKTRLN